VSIVLTFLLVTAALVVLFWAGTLLAQAWLYEQPADRLGLRAAVGGLALGLFFAFWCWLDRGSPGKYDTLFNFGGEDQVEFAAFDAIRKTATGTEQKVHYTRPVGPGGVRGKTFTDPDGKVWSRSSSDYMTVAILVKDKPDGEPVRYDAELAGNAYKYPAQLQFREANGRRYINEGTLGLLFVPRTGVVIGALALNLLHLILWFVVLWLVLEFQWPHALGLAAGLWLAMMLAVMPVLFAQNRKSSPTPAVPTAPAEAGVE
jgi:hypothetical protein